MSIFNAQRPDRRAYPLIALMVLIFAAFFLRLHDLPHTPPGINYDAAFTTAHSVLMSQGLPLPPLIFDDRPEPLNRYLLAAWFRIVTPSAFTSLLLYSFTGTLTVALAYRAGASLRSAVVGVVAAGALLASMPHVFLSRSAFRAILLPFFLLAALIFFGKAHRDDRPRHWLMAGGMAGLALNTYLAGIIAPLWALGVLAHLRFVAVRRIAWRSVGWTLAGLAPFVMLWAFTMTYLADIFYRIDSQDEVDLTLPERLLEATRAYYDAAFHPMTFYNVPTSAFLEPGFALLAVVGVVVLLARPRRMESAAVLIGLIGFTLPGALSELPTHPVRLIGVAPFLALLSGYGAVGVLALLRRIPSPTFRRARPALAGFAFAALTVFSAVSVHSAYHGLFADPDRYHPPDDWRNIPHNHSMPLVEAIEYIMASDVPVYTPINALDNRIATVILRGGAYPQVTTAGRYGLESLPAGVVIYPEYDYLFNPTPDSYPIQALLLPTERTIIVLPTAAGGIEKFSPQTETLTSERGWTVAHITPFDGRALPQTPPPDSPLLGGSLRVAAPLPPMTVTAGGFAEVVFDWHVEGRIRRGLFSFAQLLDAERRAFGGTDKQVLPFLYPSPMWRPGDVVPDFHFVPLSSDLRDDAAYRWTVGAWVSPPGQVRLTATAEDGVYLDDRLFLSAARTAFNDAPIPADTVPLDIRFDDALTLDAYTLDQDGDLWTLTLYWRSAALTGHDYSIFVHAMRGDDLIAQDDAQPAPPTWAWAVGEIVSTTHALDLPPDTTPDAIYAGLYTFPDLARAATVQDGATVDDGRGVVVIIER